MVLLLLKGQLFLLSFFERTLELVLKAGHAEQAATFLLSPPNRVQRRRPKEDS